VGKSYRDEGSREKHEGYDGDDAYTRGFEGTLLGLLPHLGCEVLLPGGSLSLKMLNQLRATIVSH
jgi:hypothetical protein